MTWAWSWVAFVAFMIATAFVTAFGIMNPQDHWRMMATFSSMATCLLHAALVLLGTLQLANKWNYSSKQTLFLLLLILIASAGLVWLYANDPNERIARYILRIGVKYVLVSAAFVAAGIYTMRNRLITRGSGQKILAAGFVLYGLLNFYYSFIVFYNVVIGEFQFPVFFGLLEMLFISVIGIGMVMWLLQDERDRLKKANQELDSFLYSTSHDLRAPIASVLGITNLAKLEIKDSTSLQYIGMIEERVKKLDLVIGDILQLSRSAKAEIKYELIDFNKLLNDVISDVKFNQGATKISLRYDVNPLNTFHGDYGQMKIIIGNLISNAVRYHRIDQPDPYIGVRFIKEDHYVMIDIEDNGEGIDSEHHEKIFEMFYRSSTKTDGTGLGLYIVKEALAKVNGTITLKSQLNLGSTFRVGLPQN
jgi:signal transduction histidine kinase